MIKVVIDRSSERADGKTALVFSKNTGFGLGRMFGALSEIEDVQIEYMSFRSISKAKEWLDV